MHEVHYLSNKRQKELYALTRTVGGGGKSGALRMSKAQ